MGTRVFSPGVKWLRHEADYSGPSSIEVKNAWSHISTLSYIFMVWYLVKHRENFTTISFGAKCGIDLTESTKRNSEVKKVCGFVKQGLNQFI
jgi:hypothetical protein